MDLIGIKVTHRTWGSGTVTEFNGEHVAVEFTIGVKQFVYPSAFESFLRAEDPDVQNSILNIIEAAKQEAERKRQADIAARRAAEERRRAANTGFPTRTTRARSLDEMFMPDYHAEKLARQPILTYEQVEEQFGIRISGFGRGINLTENTVVLISSINRSSGYFLYHDRWTPDGDYLYSGEGRTGNQTMTRGNLAIKDAARNGKKIHLFVKFSPSEYYYQGVFRLVDYTYENERDENGNVRKEYKFRLRKTANS